MTAKLRRGGAVLAVAALALVAACTGPGSPDEADPSPPEPAASASDGATASSQPDPAKTVAESVDLVVGGAEVQAEIFPLVRSGEHVVLTMDLTTDATEDVSLGRIFGGEVKDGPVQGGGIRLVDLDEKQVYLPGLDAQDDPVGAGERLVFLDPTGVRVQRVYAAPADPVGSIGALLPGAYLDEVPVVDGDVPAPTLRSVEDVSAEPVEPTDPSEVTEAPVLPLESFTAELDGAVKVLESTEEVTVSLGGDVLFDSSSATLRPDAQRAIDAAARRIQERAPGTVTVVGHTDDVGDDASNQKLSERRADAVADALGDRLDQQDYPLETSGEGESQPLVANTSDENRQLNRRVELTLVSEVTTTTDVAAEGELPPFEDGPVGTGTEGVVIESGIRTWRFTVPEARRVGDSLVLDLQVTAEDDAVDSGIGPGNLAGYWSYRGDDVTVPKNMLGLTVLSGSSAVYPYDYKIREDGDTEVWNPLGELDTLRRVDGGETVAFTAVYPGFEDAETVTVQLNHNLGAEPFRLTDIPVVD